MPTKTNREIWRLEKEIKSTILAVVKRRAEASYEKDLLQMIVDSASHYIDINSLSLGMTRDKFIVDNCKTIYLAGHETIATTASWSLMLLAANPEWQARARAEVLEIYRDGVPNADMLQSIKIVSYHGYSRDARLYPPAVYVVREALEDMKLKNILHAYVPFGVGNRICAGQHLAMMELKVILSLILSKFCFSLSSPAYQHCPTFSLVTEPRDGVTLHRRKLQL
ncbi:hypothetical protein FEM48_Zijuj06G0213200 [Ziziphus jujuba var. spinosa]|uniref:Cytochrome P450 714C2-like n=1 Tax=Ziziphus jujuba var. spinosa TaxID=714518 RepID=A0A978VBP4_ZIZJJ|nr:hypothetical protein FEM48_Zijuj06G0213200 [Ziziphus jujuba var. spinosa]